MKKIACAFPHLHVDDAMPGRHVIIHTGIHEHKFESMLVTEEIDSGSPF